MSPEVRRRRPTTRVGRLRRWSRHHPARAAVLAGALLVLLALAWTGFRVWSVGQELDEVATRAEVLRKDLVRGDAAAAQESLTRYQDAAADAADGSSGPVWWTLERLPGLGDDAAAVATVASVLDDLGRDALPPLVETADQVTARAFQPRDGTFPLSSIAALGPPAQRSEQAFTVAADELAAIDTGGLSGPVRERTVQLTGLVTAARDGLDAAYRASRLIPVMLGAEGERDHLLVFQNNAELRSTGGLPGSVSVVHAVEGAVDIVRQEAGANLPRTDRPVLPLTDAEQALYGDELGRIFLDANLTPDVPRAAALLRAHWTRTVRGDVDGVVLVDPVAVSYLLEATGPVRVPGYGQVSAADVVELVENTIYVRSTDRQVHEDYQNAVADAVFEVFADGRGDPIEVITGLVRGVAEGRIRMHLSDAGAQAEIAGTAIAGERTGEAAGPDVGVHLNDATEAKMSYYLRHRVTLAARGCQAGTQELVGSVDLVNDVPGGTAGVANLPVTVTGVGDADRGVRRGDQRVVVYLTTPVGGHLQSLGVGGRRVADPVVIEYGERRAVPVSLLLTPGEATRIEFRMRGGRGQDGPTHLEVTPTSRPGTESRVLPSAC